MDHVDYGRITQFSESKKAHDKSILTLKALKYCSISHVDQKEIIINVLVYYL